MTAARLWAIATIAMAAAAAVIWSEALRERPRAEPMCPPKDDPMAFPAMLVTCGSGHYAEVVQKSGRNRVVCLPTKGEP